MIISLVNNTKEFADEIKKTKLKEGECILPIYIEFCPSTLEWCGGLERTDF